jgi:hypothetical protein
MSQTPEDTERRLKDELTKPHPSPESSFPKPAATDIRPGFISNNQGTAWSGLMRGNEIINNGGTTYGDTNIDFTNSDTRARIDRAKEPLEKKSFYSTSFSEQAILMDQFARRIHQSDVVGSYFPAVLKVQAKQNHLILEGVSRVLSKEQSTFIQGLRNAQVAQNTAKWSQRDEHGVVENSAVVEVEETNTEVNLAILQIEKEAAFSVLGHKKAMEIEFQARNSMDSLSEIDLERQVVASLMDEAGKAKLTTYEKQELVDLKTEENQLWDKKHENQSDFADAIRDGNPDCSEYASLTAVSLAESGIKNIRVMGHVMHDSDFPLIGAHAYNVILDETGENVIGVFEGTATSGTFKQVMNDVSLEDFEKGATLVTHNAESGWSTYGTGAPAQGHDFLDFVDDPDNPGEMNLVTNIIRRCDVNAIAEAKMEYTQNLEPEIIADQIIGIYEQYGEGIKVQGWIDGIRDGMYAGDNNNNPAFAQAAQILHDYKGTMPPPMQLRNSIIEIVKNSQDRALTNKDYDLAITPEVVHMLDGPASRSLAADIQVALSNITPDELAALSADKPWLSEVHNLVEEIGNVPYGSNRYNTKSAFDYAEEGDNSYLEAYNQIASIVRQQDITLSDLQDLQQPNPQQGLRLANPNVASNTF